MAQAGSGTNPVLRVLEAARGFTGRGKIPGVSGDGGLVAALWLGKAPRPRTRRVTTSGPERRSARMESAGCYGLLTSTEKSPRPATAKVLQRVAATLARTEQTHPTGRDRRLKPASRVTGKLTTL